MHMKKKLLAAILCLVSLGFLASCGRKCGECEPACRTSCAEVCDVKKI